MSNKSILFALISLLLLVGCTKESTYKKGCGTLSTEGRKNIETIEKFEKIISNSPDLTKAEAHELMSLFSDYLVSFGEQITDSLTYVLDNDITATAIARVDSIAEKLSHRGLNLYMSEGFLEVSVSPKYLADVFKDHLSEPEYELMVIMQNEIDEPSLLDGGVVIPYQEIADRLMRCDELILEAKDDTLVVTNLREYQRLYTTLIMMGCDNTPAFVYPSKVLSSEIRDVINNLMIEHPESESTKILCKYDTILRKTDYHESEESKEFIESYIGL